MGVDGHPAPELRGLHAWLAVHLPAHAERLIDADPYGVLTYGDAASLSQTLCARLVRALERLSRTDPWFRAGNHAWPAIAGLARADMIDEIRAVLKSAEAGSNVRRIVVEAVALGPPLPALRDDLARVLETGPLPYAERHYALMALLRLGEDGRTSVLHAYHTVFGTDLASLRLRAEAIEHLYGDPFEPADVARLTDDILASAEEAYLGLLWKLPSGLPLTDLPAVLDAIQAPARNDGAARRNVWEVAAFFDRALLRVLEAPNAIDPARLLGWLRKRRAFAHAYGSTRRDELKAALLAHPERLEGMLTHFLGNFVPDDDPWLALSRFREAVFFKIGPDQLIEGMLRAMAVEQAGSQRELFFFEAALSLSYQATDGQALFDRVYHLADNRAELAEARTRLTSSRLPEGHLRRLERREAPNTEHEGDPDALRRDFARDAAAIASGAHLGGLVWAARVYLGIFDDVDRTAAPEARFTPILGDALAGMALDGLVAALDRTDVPSVQDVIDLAVQRQCRPLWYVFIAGLNERFRRTSSLEGVSDALLRAMLAFDLTRPVPESHEGSITWMQHPWKQILQRERPELVREAYKAVACANLARGDQHPDGLDELLTHEALAPLHEDVVLGLLREFPNANPFPLRKLLTAALGMPIAHTALLALADRVLGNAVPVDQPQRDLWLVTAWLLSPDRHGVVLRDTAQSRSEIVFDLRDFTGYSDNEAAPGRPTLSLEQIEFLICLAGSLYPPARYPSGVFSGERNAWDATDYVHGLVNGLSANATQAATEALSRLESDPILAAYRPSLQHALATQSARRREAEYDRPDWPRTVRALDNKQPATVADLHAVLVEHLDDLRKRIRTENTDIYRMFWNVDRYGRLISPRPEEACRDDLITLLRPRLAPLGISLEPEGHMAGDRRADISAATPARKILCEIKRDYHTDVWTAPDGQLERFYAHDPEALGFGIYLVFWFGDGRTSAIPLPPDGQPRPMSAADMEAMLRARLPADRAARTAIMVIDVTKPD
jgi:hypothetical protein